MSVTWLRLITTNVVRTWGKGGRKREREDVGTLGENTRFCVTRKALEELTVVVVGTDKEVHHQEALEGLYRGKEGA